MPVSQIYHDVAVLTNAQIKASPTTPIQIIPAPGPGKSIWPLYAVMRLAWVADYTNIHAQCRLRFLSTAIELLLPVREDDTNTSVSGLLAAGASSSAFTPASFGVIQASGLPYAQSWNFDTDTVNAALNFSATNDVSGNFTGGNAGNELIITVVYTIIDV
jgi:hypothetical protein